MSRTKGGQSVPNQGGVDPQSEVARAFDIQRRLNKGRGVVAEVARRYGISGDQWNSLTDLKLKLFEKDQQKILENCRDLRKRWGFVDSWLRLKQAYVMQGLRLGGAEGRNLADSHPEQPWIRLANDFAREYFTTGNVVASWLIPDGGGRSPEGQAGAPPSALPRVVILDTEDVRFQDLMGVEQIKLVSRSESLEGALDVERLKAYLKSRQEKQSDWIELGSTEEDDLGARHLVFSTGKAGCGYGIPPLYGLMFDLALLETLRIGDFNGALSMRDVMRQVKIGHAITTGPLAGQPTYHIKKADFDKVKATLQEKMGAYDFITRHDLDVEFPFLEPKFFDKMKYDAVWQRIMEWCGPMLRGLTAGAGEAGLIAMQAWSAEGKDHRDRIGRGLGEILNHADYGGTTAGRISVHYNPLSFLSNKEARETLSFQLNHGLVSPQTARELSGLEDELERERLREAMENPEGYRPVFEPRQGLLVDEGDNQGGKPPGEAAE